MVSLIISPGCSAPAGEYRTWTVYKGDQASTCYSSLDQINKGNVQQLVVAWAFRPQDSPDNHRQGTAECNPIVIDSIVYVTSARHRVYALQAGTGRMIWSFDPFLGGRGGGANRGVTYWSDGDDRRILVTAESTLYELNALTGEPILSFGDHGRVSLAMSEAANPQAYARPSSPGIIYKNLIILGCEVAETYGAAPGYIRAFDVRTGKLVWTFHTIPRPGEPGYETWPPGAWKKAGGANNWGGMSIDMKRGLVFAPTGSPSYDFYGADRKGENLFGNCILALDAATGHLKWYYQVVHHDLWDYDLPAPPTLLTIDHDGKSEDVLAQVTKHGFLFVLDRETGRPVFPVEERSVPSSAIPGESAWPTQPFPTRPAPYARQSMTLDDLNPDPPEGYDSLVKVFESMHYEGLFTPSDLNMNFMIPGTRGGSEWGGAAADPYHGIVYVNASESPELLTIRSVEMSEFRNQTFYLSGQRFYTNFCASCHGADRTGQPPVIPSLVNLKDRMSREDVVKKIKEGGGRMPGFGVVASGHEREIVDYLFDLEKDKVAEDSSTSVDTDKLYMNTSAYSYFETSNGAPAIKPPWGTLNAIDLNTGGYLWKVPLGNRDQWQKPGDPPTGAENYGGLIVTGGGLVFVAATIDRKFRAFDKDDGRMLWETTLEGDGHATPATYNYRGKQYVLIAVSGSEADPAGSFVAFSMP